MKTLKDACRFRLDASPYSTRALIQRFEHVPRQSVTSLLRKAGPFKPERDAYQFRNNDGWPITEEDARVIRGYYQPVVNSVSGIGIDMLRRSLNVLTFSTPLGTVGLPDVVIDHVINKVTEDLRNRLLDSVIAAIPGSYGRCGGMAFSALDFFLVGWPVDRRNVKPESGNLRQYIWTRLLDSLELNAPTFLEWVMILHILPIISRTASAVLGAAAGSMIGGALGAAVGALLAGKEDILGLGGADALLGKTRDHCGQLRAKLNREAAWPIGLVYGESANPIDQHQVLATEYQDLGNGKASLWIWDNNDGASGGFLSLDFNGDQLKVNASNSELNSTKGIICEEYTFKMPPESLKQQ